MGTSVHFRGQQCARIQVHGAVTLKTQSPDNTRKGFCDFKMSGEQPRQPKDLQGLLKFCMEATANEDAPAVPGDPAARLAAMEPERRAWLEEALDKMSVDVVEQLGNGIKVLMKVVQTWRPRRRCWTAWKTGWGRSTWLATSTRLEDLSPFNNALILRMLV